MYFRGFATGSGTKIKINEESLEKVQGLWEETDTEDYDAALQHKSTGKLSKLGLPEESFSFKGFSTATGVRISVNQKQIEKVQALFEQDLGNFSDESNGSNCTKTSCNNTALTDKVNQKSTSETLLPLQNVTAASGCKITPDKHLAEKSKATCKMNTDHIATQDDEFDDYIKNMCTVEYGAEGSSHFYTSNTSESFQDCNIVSRTNFKLIEKQIKKTPALLEEDTVCSNDKNVHEHTSNTAEPFQGFSTAAGSRIKLSEEQLRKTLALFEEDVGSGVGEKIHKPMSKTIKPFQGFSTAAGSKIKLNDEQIKKTQAIFKEGFDLHSGVDNYISKVSETCQGFSTASGAKIKLSDEQIKKTQALFKEDFDLVSGVNSYISKDSETCQGFSTATGAKIKLGEEQIKKAHGLFKEDVGLEHGVDIHVSKAPEPLQGFSDGNDANVENLHSNPKMSKSFQGFTTGSGTKIILTEKQLKKSKALFELENDNFIGQNDSSSCNFIDAGGNVDTLHKSGVNKLGPKTPPQHTFNIKNSKNDGDDDDTEVKTLMIGNSDKTAAADDDDDDDRSSSPIIGSQAVSLKRKNIHPRKNIEKSKKLFNYPDENISGLGKTSWQADLSHYEIEPTKETVNDRDAQEIHSITEAFLKDELWETEEPSDRKRKVWESLEGNDALHPRKLPKQHFEDNSRLNKEEVLKEREIQRLDQDNMIRNKQKLSIRPIQGHLYKERSGEKHKRVSLRSLGKLRLSQDCNIEVQEITADNAASFRFSVSDEQLNVDCSDGCFIIPGSDGCIGVGEVERGFLLMAGVCPKLVPTGWVSNHYTWIVWNLAAMQRRLIPCTSLTVENVVGRLKYRYDREIDRAERSIIRKISECDDIPQKTMVLCIASIDGKKTAGLNVSPHKHSDVPFMALTDGWYSIKARVDNAMIQLYREDKIRVGTKLVIHGAELIGHPSPCHPLEAPESSSLRLHTNMTRRARWWSRMGLIPQRGPIPAQLGTVFVGGGLVGRVSVVISRIYPLIYFEKSNGKSVFRGERAHLKLLKENQHYKETALHQIVSEVEKEFEEDISAPNNAYGKSSLTDQEICNLKTGKDIAQLMENTMDPNSLEGLLSTSQINKAQAWRQEQASERKRKMSVEVQRRLDEKQRIYQATPLLKLRILDSSGCIALLTIWRPPEELQQELSEGMAFNLQYVMATGYKRGCLQMTASRHTLWERVADRRSETFPDVSRHVTSLFSTMSNKLSPTWNEIDVVGVVFRIEEMSSGFQLVHIVDHHINLLTVKFWGGLKEFGVEEMIRREAMICISNGSWRGYNGGRCGCIHVTELTSVTSSPRSGHLVEAFTTLKDSIEDMKALIREADAKLDGNSGDLDSLLISDGDSVSSVESVKTEKSSNVESTVEPQIDQEANCTDKVLTPWAKRLGERSKDMRSRLHKLSRYGTPSPLGHVVFGKPSPRTHRPFKSPIRQLPS